MAKRFGNNRAADAEERFKNQAFHLQWRFYQVYTMCCDYFVSNLTAGNCIDTALFAAEHQYNGLSDIAFDFIDKNFEKVFTSDEFLELSSEQMLQLIPLLEYNEMQAIDVERAISLWIKYKRNIRLKYKKALLR